MKAARWHQLVAALLLAGSAVLLTTHLAADTPGHLDGSAGLVFDPPSKCHNARNWALFGSWIEDEWTPIIHSPLYTILQGAILRVLGVGLAQLRLLGVVATLLSLMLLYRLARQNLSAAGALAVLAVAASSRTLMVYGRSGLLEPLATLFGLLSLWLLSTACPPRGPRPLRLFAAGCAVTLAFLAKATAWPYVLAILITPLIAWRGQRRALGWVLAGALPVVVWYAAWFMPTFAEHFQREASYWSERAQTAGPWLRWIRQPLFLLADDLRPVLVAALMGLPLCFVLPRDEQQRRRWLVPLACSVVFLAGSQFVAFVNYRPLRYYLPYLWPALIPAALLVEHLIQYAREKKAPALSMGLALACLPTAALALHFGVLNFLPRTFPLLNLPAGLRLLAALGLTSLLLTATAWLSRRAWANRALRIAAGGLALALIGFTAQASGQGLREMVRWLREPTFAMQTFSQRLGRDYRNAVFAGTSPLFSVIENGHRALKVTSYQLNHRAMRDGAATHLLIPQGMGQDRVFRELFPALMEQAVPLARPVISGFTHALYAVSLQPLERIGLDTVRNPDRFSPQELIQAVRPAGELLPAAQKAIRHILRPGEQATVATDWLMDEGQLRRLPGLRPKQKMPAAYDPDARDLRSLRLATGTELAYSWTNAAITVVLNVKPEAAGAMSIQIGEHTRELDLQPSAEAGFVPLLITLPPATTSLTVRFTAPTRLDYAVALADEELSSVVLSGEAPR